MIEIPLSSGHVAFVDDTDAELVAPYTWHVRRGSSGLLYAQATSGFKGVYWKQRNHKWCAQIGTGGMRRYLGLYSTPEDAARAYNVAALARWGEFASLNTIPEPIAAR